MVNPTIENQDAVTDIAAKPKNNKQKREPLRIGLLGCGAINSTVAKMIANRKAGPSVLAAILVRKERSEEELRSLLSGESDTEESDNQDSVVCTTDADKFFATDSDWTLCVEAAGQPAVRQYGKRCLEMGRDLMITSIGSLTDDVLYNDLRDAAEANGGRLILCTGSMPALDWMGSAALLEDRSAQVKVTQIKPPQAWLGTPAATDHPDLLALSRPRVLFEGSSRDAASTFPKNANVAAMLALATAGLDETEASLVADPDATGNRVEISFRGAAGTIAIQVEAAPSKTNPRTSAVVALSVVKAIRKLCCPVVIGL
mmetsp:Transcript_32012/g.39272  ORF Transcript_32012/g.39272 Transcript_32012/m.39272 type:complete len:315 (-) Transcript_32012:393-1337(-)